MSTAAEEDKMALLEEDFLNNPGDFLDEKENIYLASSSATNK
jgi:hypothetical protein